VGKSVQKWREMFFGSFKYNLDAKGRVSIPSKFRKNLNSEANETFVMTRGFNRCIFLYPADYWKNVILKRINQIDDFDDKENKFMRMMFELTSDDQLDSQSRLLIPKNLKEFAGIEKEVFILGANNKIELWNPDIYRQYIESSEETFEELAKEVMQSKV
jgi:MraZ protein